MGFIRLISGLGVTFFFLSQLAQVLKLIFLLLVRVLIQGEMNIAQPYLMAQLGHHSPSDRIYCVRTTTANQSSEKQPREDACPI